VVVIGQVPALMGVTGFDIRTETCHVFINCLEHLGRSQIDAALGLTAFFLLYATRYYISNRPRSFPSQSVLFLLAPFEMPLSSCSTYLFVACEQT